MHYIIYLYVLARKMGGKTISKKYKIKAMSPCKVTELTTRQLQLASLQFFLAEEKAA